MDQIFLESAVDKLGITTKRTTYEYNLPTSVVKGGSAKPSVIKHETFKVDWSKKASNSDENLSAKVIYRLLRIVFSF